MRMTQVVMLTDGEPRHRVHQHVVDLCESHGLHVPPDSRYFTGRLGKLHFVWESHTEFSVYSFIKEGSFSEPFASPVLAEVPLDWVERLPGRTIRATQIALIDRSAPEPASTELAKYFNTEELVCCDVLGGEARIWSDFRLHDDGLGRLLIRDQSLHSQEDTARLVQRIQELGNYRNMALLGLPLAQRLTPELTALEQRLAELTREIAAGHAGNDDELLQQLSALSAHLARLMAETRYRMTATRAYAQLASDCLRVIDSRRIAGHRTLIDFAERRLTPAVRTCEWFSDRAEDLSRRASWANSLMRTRIETVLERQSKDLLESMNQRAGIQLRLQQTVEGLSFLAITYYAVGIFGYLLKAVGHFVPALDTPMVPGLAIPAILGVVWGCLRGNARPKSHSYGG